MNVKQLIEKLQQMNPEQNVYLGDNELNDETYFYMVQNVREHNIEDEEFVVLTYRK